MLRRLPTILNRKILSSLFNSHIFRFTTYQYHSQSINDNIKGYSNEFLIQSTKQYYPMKTNIDSVGYFLKSDNELFKILKSQNSPSSGLNILVSKLLENFKKNQNEVNNDLSNILIFISKNNFLDENFKYINSYINVPAKLEPLKEVLSQIDFSLFENDKEIVKFIRLFNFYSNFVTFNESVFDRIEREFDIYLTKIAKNEGKFGISNLIFISLIKNYKDFKGFFHKLSTFKEQFLTNQSFAELMIIFREIAEIKTNKDQKKSFNEFLESLFEALTTVEIKEKDLSQNSFYFFIYILRKTESENLSIDKNIKKKLQTSLVNLILSSNQFKLENESKLELMLELSNFIEERKLNDYFKNLYRNTRTKDISSIINIINYFGMNFNYFAKSFINALTNNITLNEKEGSLSYQEIIRFIYSLSNYDSYNAEHLYNQTRAFLHKSNIKEIENIFMILFSQTKIGLVRDYDNHEFYLKFMLMYEQNTLKNNIFLKNNYSKVLWTFANFANRTEKINPIFIHILSQIKEIEIENLKKDDYDYFISSFSLIELLLNKNLFTNCSELSEIVPVKIMDSILQKKIQLNQENFEIQNNMKIIGEILLSNRINLHPFAPVGASFADYYVQESNTSIIIIKNNDYNNKDELSSSLSTRIKYLRSKSKVIIVNVDEVKKGRMDEINKLDHEILLKKKSFL